MSDSEELSADPVSSLLGSTIADEVSSVLDPQDPKEKAKLILERGSPLAARRLVQIAEHSDAKDAGPACRAVLESVGLGKRETGSPAPVNQLLSAAALLGALAGIGKVLGLKEADQLKNVTPQEEPVEKSQEAVFNREGTGELLLPAPLHSARRAPSEPVHQPRLRKASGAKKKPVKSRGSR